MLQIGEVTLSSRLILGTGRYPDFGTMQAAVEDMGLEALSSDDEYVPSNVMELGEDETTAVLELIDRLEQDDDVQKVFHNLA